MKWRAELDLATEAAHAAGEYLRRAARAEIEVLSEVGRNIKLAADRESERIILAMLRERSGHPILAEESGEHDDPGAGLYWAVDPLDGSANFSRGIPMCCISIALMRDAEPLLGVIHDFHRGETYRGVDGEGAWLGEPAIRVSDRAEPGRCVLATGFPVGRDFGEAAMSQFIREARAFKKVRMIGSAAMALAWVARGWVDAYGEDDIMLWDVAAGIALVRAAGGHVTMSPSARKPWAFRVRAASAASVWTPLSG